MTKPSMPRLLSFTLAAVSRISPERAAILRDAFGAEDNSDLADKIAADIDNMAPLPIEERRALSDTELEIALDAHIRCVLGALCSTRGDM